MGANRFLDFFLHKIDGERPPSPDRAWQIPTDTQIKNSAKTNTRVKKSTLPSPAVPRLG